ALLEHDIGAGAEKKRAKQSAAAAIDLDRLGNEAAHDLSRARIGPARRSQHVVGPPMELGEKALVEVMEQRVLVWKPAIERAHRDSGALHDLRQRCLAKRLLRKHLLGGIQNPVESLTTPNLLRRAKETRRGHPDAPRG